MKYVVTYESTENVVSKAPAHYVAHPARVVHPRVERDPRA
jgi:hypothetical protein